MPFAAVPMPIRDNPDSALIVYTVLMIVLTTGFFAWWLASRTERRIGPALPFLLIGGALSGLMEAWLDNVVLVGWPPEQNLPVIHAFDRSVPMFVPIGYAWFCGGLVYILARTYQRNGITAKNVWVLYGAVVVVDFVAIGLSHWLGILEFFGDPPMSILGFPLWWAAIDGLQVVLGGVAALLLLDHLRGMAQAWLVLLPSIVLGAAAGIVGWPISTAINSAWSDPAKWACAVASIGLSLACILLISKVAPRAAEISRRIARGDAEATANGAGAAGVAEPHKEPAVHA